VSSLYDFIKRTAEQKKKYHAKVLTDDAIFTNLLNSINTEQIFSEFAWSTVPQFNLSALANTILFNIAPSELEPINVDFQISLPSVEEMEQGIIIKIEPISVEMLPPWLMFLDLFIDENIKELYRMSIKETTLKKGVYGVSRFGQAYYDPPAVAQFIRSTLYKVFQEKQTLETVKKYIESMKDTLKINEFLARSLFERVSLVIHSQFETFILGYGVLGKSKLGRKGSASASVKYINYDLQETEANINNLSDVLHGLILGLGVLGYGLLPSKEPLYKEEEVTSATGYKTYGAPKIVRFIAEKVGKLRGRYSATALAIANYSRSKERESYLYSERADQYMNLQLIRYMIENMVDPIIRKYETSPVRIRMYKSAVLQLISYPAKRHRWGYKAFEVMSDEEFYDWWLSTWVKQGLKESVLKELYEVVSKWMREYRKIKLQLGMKLKQRRYQLALSLP